MLPYIQGILIINVWIAERRFWLLSGSQTPGFEVTFGKTSSGENVCTNRPNF